MSTTDHAKIVEDILGDWGWADEEVNVVEEQDNYLYVVGMDPGGTTGVAILRVDTVDQKKLPELVFLDQIPDAQYGFKDYFADFYINPENTVVASEVWVEHHKKGVDRTPYLLQGVIHALWDDRDIAWQEPALKVMVTDEFLKEQGVWTEGMPHQMDALRHAIIWLRNQEHEGTVGALGGEDTEGSIGEGGYVQGDGTQMGDGASHELAAIGRDATDERGTGPGETVIGYFDGDGTFEEPKGKRKERELNGAFTGFESAESEAGENEVSLLDD